MWRKQGLVLGAVLVLMAGGCGKPEGKPGDAAPQSSASTPSGTDLSAAPDSPAGVVTQFLTALKTGNDQKALQLLSTAARKIAAEKGLNATASDTARFEVGQVDLKGSDGAWVSCTWTDLDGEGKPQTDRAIWVVRREAEGWRVVGVAAEADGEEPLVRNFEEDPEKTPKTPDRPQRQADARDLQKTPPRQIGEKPQDSLRR